MELQSLPQAAYNNSVTAGALADNLPDILDMDGPSMPNWARAGYMQPLQIDERKIANFLPGTKGIYDGKLYSIGLWDAAVALVTRQSTLDDLKLRTPKLAQRWTAEEFQGALDAAKASGKFKFAFDPGMAWTGEWYPYAFSTFLQSFGGDIVDRMTCQTAKGALNAMRPKPGTSGGSTCSPTAMRRPSRTAPTATTALSPVNMPSRATATGRL